MLKKILKGMNVRLQGIIIGFAIFSLLSGTIVFASQSGKMISVIYNKIKIVVDGKSITPKDAQGKIVEPFLYNGTIYMPVKAVGEAAGKTVYWDGKKSTVYFGKIDGKTPVENLTKLTVFKGNELTLNAAGYTDNTGILHHPAAEVGGDNWDNDSPTYTGTYLLNMKYSRLKGNVSLDSRTKNSTFEIYLNIYGDDKLIYTSKVIASGSYPQDFNVDVSGVVQLRLEIDGQSRSVMERSYIILSGLDLYN